MIPQASQTQEPRMQTPDIRIALSHFLRQIEAGHVRTNTQRPKPLHYSADTQGLREFSWPCEPNPDSKTPWDKVKRVAPGDLESHRRTHRFRAPSCLCAFIDGVEYTEAQIAIVEVLTKDETRNHCLLNGEFVAQCSRQRCGYLLCLERFYPLSDLSVRYYTPRATPLPVQDLIHVSDIEKSFRRGDGLFQVMPDVVLRGNRRGLDIVSSSETKAVRDRLWTQLMTGMAEDDFWCTFVQCMQCGKVAFREHYAINHAPRCSGTTKRGRTVMHPNIRHHPYRRNANIDSANTLPIGMRLLARIDTLIGDQPQSLEDAYHYDSQDVTVPDSDSEVPMARESSGSSGFETAQEDALDNDGDFLGSDDLVSEAAPTDPDFGSSGLWWQHDVPELGSDDSLPDIMTILEQTGQSQLATSNVRTHLGDDSQSVAPGSDSEDTSDN